MGNLIQVVDDIHVRTVRLNRAEKKNALTLGMYSDLAEVLNASNRNGDIRAVVITGGPQVFCAGNDMQDFIAAHKAGALGKPVLEFLTALVTCEKPMVAAVANLAIGIGVTMLFHFDYVVASNCVRFRTPFTSLGIIPEAASGLIAPRLMGHARAFAMLVLNHPVNGAEAKELGFVNELVPIDEVDQEAGRIARELAQLPPDAVAANRRLLKGSADKLVERLRYEDEILKTRLRSAEAGLAFERFFSARAQSKL